MQIITLNTNNLEHTFTQLKKQLGGLLDTKQKEYTLALESDKVHGEITGVSVNRTISFIEYHLRFKEDTVIEECTAKTSPIQFLYCVEGQIAHAFGKDQKQRVLKQFQTGIFASDPSLSSSLLFKKGQPVRLSSISVAAPTEVSRGDTTTLLQKQLSEIFVPKKSEIFAYIGSYNLKIAEQVQELEDIKQGGIVRRLFIKGIVHTMLALEIEQHKQDLKNARKNLGSLTRSEMDTVQELATFIQNYPEVNYTLAYLSEKGGLSPAKLQEGFKLLHNRTAADYIRNVRIETAEQLIKTTDMNISEIVYAIGLTSRSYFSKIFKAKYNCSPKDYQDHQSLVAIAT